MSKLRGPTIDELLDSELKIQIQVNYHYENWNFHTRFNPKTAEITDFSQPRYTTQKFSSKNLPKLDQWFWTFLETKIFSGSKVGVGWILASQVFTIILYIMVFRKCQKIYI